MVIDNADIPLCRVHIDIRIKKIIIRIMKKNICADLGLLHPLSVNSGRTATVGIGMFSKIC